MNIFRRKPLRLLTTTFSMLVSIAILSACGGGGGGSSDTTAGIGGTGIVYGRITGFGSVFVNGRKFEIDNSQIIVDGVGGQTENELRLGMIVQLKVKTENGSYTDESIEVVYDDEIEGPFAAVPLLDPTDPTLKTGNVFGQTINFSDTTTIYEFTSFENLGNEGNPGDPDVVEISGYRVSDTEINATYVRFDDDLLPGITEVELRGPIKMLMGSPPNETFQVDGIDITTNMSTVRNVPGGVPVPDLYVEVEGKIQGDSSVIATEYEFEDEDFDDDVDDISMQGVVSGFAIGGISNFFIDSQRVDASNVQPVPVLMDGMNVEVEGEIVASTLIADEVEIHDSDSKLRSFVDNVNTTTTNTFEVVYTAVPGAVTVHVDDNTLFEDETGPLVTSPFSLDDLRNNSLDFVRVEGVEIANNEVLATFVRRTSPDDDLKLEGQVDGYVLNTSITVLGVRYGLEPGTTTYDPPGAESIIGPDDFVEIEDKRIGGVNPPGTADEVELE